MAKWGFDLSSDWRWRAGQPHILGDGREENEYVPALFELVAGGSRDDGCDDGVGTTAAAARAPTSALGLVAAARTAAGAGMAPPRELSAVVSLYVTSGAGC